jgi:hypothetical protein
MTPDRLFSGQADLGPLAAGPWKGWSFALDALAIFLAVAGVAVMGWTCYVGVLQVLSAGCGFAASPAFADLRAGWASAFGLCCASRVLAGWSAHPVSRRVARTGALAAAGMCGVSWVSLSAW